MLFLLVDAPLVTVGSIAALRDAQRPSDEAVAAAHGERIEPLVALYDRRSLLREGLPMLVRGDVAVHWVVERLRARFVSLPAEQFANLNTLEDWEAIFGASPLMHDADG